MMQTKFHLLPVGQHFEWEGNQYVKSTPLLANLLPEGGQKFMPKAAMVTLRGTAPAIEPAAKPATPLDSRQVQEAVTRYHRRCLELSCHPQQEAAVVHELREGLEQLYRELLSELKL